MKAIFTALLAQMEHRRGSVLVTIVGDRGSAPRGTGAQMLVGAEGRLSGTIGGGSVEKTCVELALVLLEQKQSLLREFRLYQNDREDIGMICGGTVTVWFQYIAPEDHIWRELTGRALACFREAAPAWFVQDLRGGAPSLVERAGGVPAGRTGNQFAMPLPVGERAVIFGAGHISQALVPLLKSVGFRPVVFDCRPDYALPGLFPDAEMVLCGDYLRIDQYLTITPEDYIVVMTSGHGYDFEVQRQLLGREQAYIGVIGSRKKTAAVNERLLEAGIPEEAIHRVHAPIGTKIKAVTPEEIAVSIAGEMICERAVRRENGGQESHSCPV